jgi:flagellar hook-associated protein FlgK
MAGNISSTVDSINSMSDSIEDLNKKIKEEQETEAFRVKEEKWYLEE